VTVRPPGWRPDPFVFDGVNLATAMEFDRCPVPADAAVALGLACAEKREE
jgi:hypothetical protein